MRSLWKSDTGGNSPERPSAGICAKGALKGSHASVTACKRPAHQQLKQKPRRRINLPSPAWHAAGSAVVVQFTLNGYASNGRMSVIIYHHALFRLQKCHYRQPDRLFTLRL